MSELSYEEAYQLSISDPATFWDIQAKNVIWNSPYTSVIEEKESVFPKWYDQ